MAISNEELERQAQIFADGFPKSGHADRDAMFEETIKIAFQKGWMECTKACIEAVLPVKL